MRIAHVVETLEIGGAETLVSLLSRSQRESGHDVSIHCIFSGGTLADSLQRDGFPVDIAPPGSRFARMAHLRRRFAELRTEAVHLHNATATIIAAPAAKAAGVRSVISTRHGLVAPPYGMSREIQYSLASRFCCSTVTGVCEATTRNLKGAPLADPSKIRTVYNGATPASRTQSPDLPEKRGITFVTVGRLAPPKDHLLLIEALEIARRTNPEINLWIVGDGGLRPSLTERAQALKLGDAVQFLGSRSNVGDYLAAADAFVLSSQSEGLPVSQLEAMAEGLPSVVSDVGAMPELAKGGDCGIVVPVRDTNAMAAALIECAGNSELRSRLGANAKQHYLRHFTLEIMAKQYEQLYRSSA